MAKKCKLIKVTPPIPTVEAEAEKNPVAENLICKRECLKELLLHIFSVVATFAFCVVGWVAINECLDADSIILTVIFAVLTSCVVIATVAFIWLIKELPE